MATGTRLPRLPAERRTVFGNKLRALRRQGRIPAKVTRRGEPDLFIQFDDIPFRAAYREVGTSGVVSVQLDGTSLPAMVKRVDPHPTRREILHVELSEVDRREPVVAEVAVILAGEAPAGKLHRGVILHHVETLKVRGLPRALPHAVEVDASTLAEVGDRVLAEGIPLPRGVELVTGPETVVVSVTALPVMIEEEPAEAPAGPGETPEALPRDEASAAETA